MVNYFPRVDAGYEMWAAYDGPQCQADFAVARGLGFEVVRVNLAARTGAFNFPTPTSGQLDALADLQARAAAEDLLVQWSLFDHWESFGLFDASDTWLGQVLGVVAGAPTTHAIEIKNEIRFASTDLYIGGFDAGWPAGEPQPTQKGPAAIAWARHTIAEIRAAHPGMSVTLSCAHGLSDLTAIATATVGTADEPDWYDWHCYADFDAIDETLADAVNIVGDPSSVYIGETGTSSAPQFQQTPGEGQRRQARYIQAVRHACGQLGLPEPAPWILYDLEPSAQFATGQTFGLLDLAGALKSAGQLYSLFPLGAAVPAPGPPQAGGGVVANAVRVSDGVTSRMIALYRG